MAGVSVIIPALNAAATLPRTLEALAGQDHGRPFEVIVVDDGSSDRTVELAEGSPVVTTVVRGPHRGPGAARNAGVAAARGELLAFTDADCYPTPGWLRAGLAALETADLAQGAVEPEPGVRMRPFDRSVWVSGETGLYECASLFCRRSTFELAGGFEDWLRARVGKALAEDVWFGWSARRAGARTRYCSDALVNHAVFRRGPIGYVGERARVAYFPAIMRKVPELRGVAFARIFLSRRSAAFDLALLSLATAAALGSAVPLLGAVPYLAVNAGHAFRWRRWAPAVAAVDVLADAFGFLALLSGTVRHASVLL